MSFERLLHHRALRFCALICLSLLLLAFFCAPIHKHETAQDSSCLFCHATTRAERPIPAQSAALPLAAVSGLADRHIENVIADEAVLAILIPRAPPA